MSAPERADELRDGREVRRGVPAERDERHVLSAEALDSAAADDAVGVGAQDDGQEHRRRVGGRAGVVVPEARVEARQVDRLVQQVMRGVLEGAGQQLGGEIHRQEARARVDVLVAGHGGGSTQQGTGGTFTAARRAIRG